MHAAPNPVRGELLGAVQETMVYGVTCWVCGQGLMPGQLSVSQMHEGHRVVVHMTCPTELKPPAPAKPAAAEPSNRCQKEGCSNAQLIGHGFCCRTCAVLAGAASQIRPGSELKPSLAVRVQRQATGEAVGTPEEPPSEKEQRYQDSMGAARTLSAATCLMGLCGNTQPHDLQCILCARPAHAVCLQVRAPHRGGVLGYTCVKCRAKGMGEDNPSAYVNQKLLELTLAETGDAKKCGVEDMRRNLLSAAGRFAVVAELQNSEAPLNNKEALKLLLRHTTEAGHVPTMKQHLTAMRALMAERVKSQPELVDWTRDADVEQVSKDMAKRLGKATQPAAPLTVEIQLEAMVLVRASRSAPKIKTRRLLNSLLSFLGALRGGEMAAGKGDHYLTASGVSIGVTNGWVKLVLHKGTKTDPNSPRVYVAAVTESGFALGRMLVEHCREWGIAVDEVEVPNLEPDGGGLKEKVLVLDHKAVHLNLAGIVVSTPRGAAFMRQLEQALAEYPDERVRQPSVRGYLLDRARARAKDADRAAEDRYVNLSVGRGAVVSAQVAWLREKLQSGLRSLGMPVELVDVRVGLAPLLANTVGVFATGMPLEYDTSLGDLKKMWQAGHESLQERLGIEKEAWVNLKLVPHSGRRGGCTRARRVAQKAGISPDQLKEYVYCHFRWSMEEGEMQEVYTDHLGRTECLRITKCI